METDIEKIKQLMEMKNFERLDEYDRRILLENFHKQVTSEPLLTEDAVDKIVENSIREYKLQYEDVSFRKYFLGNEHPNYIPEGIDVNRKNYTISYNPNHEDYVSTSVDTNPSWDESFGKGVHVWSIFKRNKTDRLDDLDGNPLVYALKGELGWRFNPRNDRQKIMNQITLIIDKFNNSHQYGTTVMVPSGGTLNNLLANLVKERNPKTKIIKDVLSKMSTEEVVNSSTGPGSKFQKIYNTEEKFYKAMSVLKIYIYEMNKQKNGLFTFHFVKDNLMRSAIGQSLKITYGADKIYASDINDKDILIIDDTISQGNTIKNAVELIKSTFIPKSITVLTLFSKL